MMNSRDATILRTRPTAAVSLAPEYDSAYYSDCFVRPLGSLSGKSALAIYQLMTRAAPSWVNWLLHIRDWTTRMLGMIPTRGFQDTEYPSCTLLQPGENLDFFQVVANVQQELVLKLEDSHFFVSISLYIEKASDHERLYLTSIVTPYSRIGRLYINLIAPFHRKIAKTMMSTLA